MPYLTIHSVHFVMVMVKDLTDSEIGNLLYHSVGYSFQVTARNLLYVLSHKQGNTCHSLFIPAAGYWPEWKNTTVRSAEEI